MILIFFI